MACFFLLLPGCGRWGDKGNAVRLEVARLQRDAAFADGGIDLRDSTARQQHRRCGRNAERAKLLTHRLFFKTRFA
jgi:hypothetical protein